MKKVILVAAAVVAASLVSGCAPQYKSQREQEMTRAAITGAAMNQALQNAHDAAFGQNGYQTEEQKEQEEYRYNQSRQHKHHRHDTDDRDYPRGSRNNPVKYQDNGVVYRDGQQGYLDANGRFHAY